MQDYWNKLKRDFGEKRCIVFLGPRIPVIKTKADWAPVVEELALFIAEQLDQYEVDYLKEEEKAKRNLPYVAERFLSIKGARRVDLEDVASDFLQKVNQGSLPSVYEFIAKLPVEVFVNATPDDLITTALKQIGKTPQYFHYNFRLTSESKRMNRGSGINIDHINSQNPLVFNLFGNMADQESLVLTETDQMEFIRNVVKGDPPIPDELLSYFDHRKTYMFLGFNIENWQFRLLLDSLNLSDENFTLAPDTTNYPTSKINKSFYKERFNFFFVEKEVEDFTKEILENIQEERTINPKHIHIVFDEEDRFYLQQLEKQLNPLKQSHKISIWHKDLAEGGTDVKEASKQQMEQADIVLLLMSADLLANESIFTDELAWALQQKQEKKCEIIPVILRPCPWRDQYDLRFMDSIPKDGTPFTADSWSNLDEALYTFIVELKNQLI